MSELTTCNYCSWQMLKKNHPTAKLVPEHGGVSVYEDTQFLAWFMQLTKGCACD